MKLWHVAAAMILAGVGGYLLHRHQYHDALEAKKTIAVPAKTSSATTPAAAKDKKPDNAKPVEPAKPDTRPSFAVACKDLSEKLMRCEPYTCSHAHPMDKDFIVKQTVVGRAENGLCVHMQTAPNNMLVVCHYSDEMKLLVAKNMEVPRPAELSPDEQKMLSAEFPIECDVFDTKTGKKIN